MKYGRVVSAAVIKTQFVFTTRVEYQDSLTQLYNKIEETVLAMNETAEYTSFFVETSVSSLNHFFTERLLAMGHSSNVKNDN